MTQESPSGFSGGSSFVELQAHVERVELTWPGQLCEQQPGKRREGKAGDARQTWLQTELSHLSRLTLA